MDHNDAYERALHPWTDAYRAAHLERHRTNNGLQAARRKAHAAGLPNTVTAEEMADTLAYYHGRCAYCLWPLGTVHWDHVIPVVRDGGSTQGNLVPACPPCNLRKGARLLWDVLRI
jgi:5-methylcytosine-specific restriction endonuclease McrA